MSELKKKLLKDFERLDLPNDFSLELRGYSKTYNGRYYIKDKKIVVYTIDEYGSQINYDIIFGTLIHESVHHYQWQHENNFVRIKGVMHNSKFWKVYRHTIERALYLGIIKEDYADVI